MKRKFYFEYDEENKTWDVLEEDPDASVTWWSNFHSYHLFSCPTKEDAKDALKLLMELQDE